MLPNQSSLSEYKRKVAEYLRQKEAHMRRGHPEKVDELERLTDVDLLKKWSWMSAICGLIACYFVIPFFVGIIGRFLPLLLTQFLWAFVKVSMGLVIAMFLIALYFTVSPGKNN